MNQLEKRAAIQVAPTNEGLKMSAVLGSSLRGVSAADGLVDMTVGELLRAAADRAPGRTALVVGSVDPADRAQLTYAELLDQAERCARALLARFEPGERVAIWAPNILQWVPLQLGLALAGMPMVAMIPSFSADEAEEVLRKSGCAGVFAVSDYKGRDLHAIVSAQQAMLPDLRETWTFNAWDSFLASGSPDQQLPQVAPSECVQIQYTSGTTGSPKGAILTHRGVVNNVLRVAERGVLTEGTVFVTPMLLCHVGGCVGSTLLCIAAVGTLIPMTVWDPALHVELMETQRATLTAGVPTMLLAALNDPSFASRDLSALDRVILGAAGVPAQLVRDLEERLDVSVVTMYGQTEAGPVATMVHPDDSAEDKAYTVGKLLPGWEARIVDPETGQDVGVGVVGEFVARGPMMMSGYFGEPQQTASAIDSQGWLHTGDLCTVDDRGFYRVAGRLKEMIIRGGANVYPRQIEDVVLTHPDVGEVAVIGLPDERLGEVVAAFVKAAPGRTIDREAMTVYVSEKLARYKVPALWFQVDSFPITATNKLRKHELRAWWERGDFVAL